ncbi:MAG: hypothetical protein IKS39_01010 [Clostridia bacterium]|nr:hypothetical protein [Clostridia bacterium]
MTAEETASVTELETESTTESTTKETTAANHDAEPKYVQAVKTAYNKIKAERDADGGSDSPITAYMTDLNGDGYKDIIYQPYWFPFVLIYNNGSFVECEIDDEVVGGSIFPSGSEESGYFIDSEKGIIVIRYDGHTTGTITYRGAEASKISGTKAERIWIEYYDDSEEKFADEFAKEEYDLINGTVDAEYNSKQYYPRIKDYNLVNYYDVCSEWNGSVI